MISGLRALDKSTPYKTRDAATHQKPSLNNTLKVLIAFALVDRTDSYDLSPTSSRTSKKSLDLPGESMDTLRMHSVIQRYLIEYLASKKQHVFWLGRSVEVFCKAFGEADARIKENPRVGMPDDYKRFLLHGKRLLAHLKHYARRSPEELQPLRRRMEDKLPVIEAEADRLHKEIQAKIVGQEGLGSGDMYQQTSIFDRANSLSESDSGTTSSQSHSQQDWTPLDEDFSGYFLSPVVAAADQLYNAYGVPVLPYPVDDDDDDNNNAIDDEYDDEEATPVLQQDTPKGGFPPAGALFGESGWQTITEPPRAHAQQPWQQKKSSSSSTALLTSRGKEDNNHKSSPAGVSVSRHTAEAAAPRRGSHVSSRDSLAEIRKHSPTPPRGGGGVIKGGGGGWSSSQASTTSSATRPLATTGLLSSTTVANHHGTQVAAGLAPAPSPAEFATATASSLAGVSAASSGGGGGSPSGWTSTGGRRSDESSRSGGAMPPFPALATLSTRSSPGQGAGPFYPPGPPVERHSNSSLRLVVEHAPPPPPGSYHPGMGMGGLPRVESSSLGQDDDGAMTMSYPPPRTTTTAERSLRRQPGGVFAPPPPPPPPPTTSMPLWPPSGLEADESSTPMSRSNNNSTSSGGGGVNSPVYGSRHRSPDSTRGGGAASPSATGNTSTIPDRGRRHSSSLASPVMMMMPPPSQQRFSPASATSGRTNCSRPASVVTEPSPRMRPRYDVLDMPYPVPLPPVPFAGMPTPNSSHHHQQQQQQIARFGGGGAGGGGTATAHFPRPALQARQSRYKRAWGKFRSGRGGGGSNNNNHATTTTAGGSTTSRGRSSTSTTMTTQSSPDPSFSSPPVPPPVSGGEPMGRSGSGGIVVVGRGGGRNHERRTMIAFGDAPVDVDGAAQRLRQRREKSFQKGLAAAVARREGDNARDNNAARVGGMDNNNDDDDKESNKRNIDAAGAGGSGVGLGITPKGGGQETR